ncbi:hypothetical protein pb186bvf_004921 [Paramecium bursaria]
MFMKSSQLIAQTNDFQINEIHISSNLLTLQSQYHESYFDYYFILKLYSLLLQTSITQLLITLIRF